MCNGSNTVEFKIFETEIIESNVKDGAVAGAIKSDGKSFIHVTCADGSTIGLTQLQMAGKKRMDVKNFLLGFREIESYRFF